MFCNVLSRTSTSACFSYTNSHHRAVQRKIKTVDTTAICSKGCETLHIIHTHLWAWWLVFNYWHCARDVPLPQSVQTSSGTLSNLIQWVLRALVPEHKASSADLKNEWSHSSTPPYSFMAFTGQFYFLFLCMTCSFYPYTCEISH
jgi:hypothetical protein